MNFLGYALLLIGVLIVYTGVVSFYFGRFDYTGLAFNQFKGLSTAILGFLIILNTEDDDDDDSLGAD